MASYFSAPKGEIKNTHLKFVHGEYYPEEAYIGFVNIGKSFAGADFLIKRCLEYPGMNCILSRDYAKELRTTTARIFYQRASKHLIGKDHNNLRYTFAEKLCPFTGRKVNSRVEGWGLALITNLDDEFRSHAFGTSLIEEGNLVSTDMHDGILGRLRQDVFHISKTVADLALAMGLRWGVTPEEAYEIMYADYRHSVGRLELDIDAPMPAPMVQKTLFNPRYQEPLWARYVDVSYPKKITPKWVEENIGVKEVYTSGIDLMEENYYPYAGEEFILIDQPIEERFFVEYADEHSKCIKFINVPQAVPMEQVKLVKKRNTLFGFTHQNKSANRENASNMFLMQNRKYRKQLTMGFDSKDVGMVFPDFIDDYFENGGHIIKLTNEMLNRGRIGIGGLDKGGGHPHAIINSFYTGANRGIIIFDEFLRNNISNIDAAEHAREMILPQFVRQYWGYDPSMDKRTFNQNIEERQITHYYEALGQQNLYPGIKGMAGFQMVNMLLKFDLLIDGKKPMPRLLVSEDCEYTIEALKTLKIATINNSRDNVLVDVGDSIKVMASIVDMVVQSIIINAVPFDMQPQRVDNGNYSF